MPPKTVLIADDDEATSRLIAYVLNEHDLSLHRVDDGEHALQFLRHEGQFRNSPLVDLLLLDLNMPRVTGLEVLRTIRSDPALRATPVAVFSQSKTKRQECLDLGVCGYYSKQSSLTEFVQSLLAAVAHV